LTWIALGSSWEILISIDLWRIEIEQEAITKTYCFLTAPSVTSASLNFPSKVDLILGATSKRILFSSSA